MSMWLAHARGDRDFGWSQKTVLWTRPCVKGKVNGCTVEYPSSRCLVLAEFSDYLKED